jgi:hypothetical protein
MAIRGFIGFNQNSDWTTTRIISQEADFDKQQTERLKRGKERMMGGRS